jgi:Zn-dependent protease with chaperone function
LSSATAKAKDKDKTKQRQQMWKLAAKALKMIRIPLVVLSVYQIGYHQGIVDYARNPNAKRAEMFATVLKGVGCDSSRQTLEDEEATKEEDPTNETINRTKSTLPFLVLREGQCNRHRKYKSEWAYRENARPEWTINSVAVVGEDIVRVAKRYVKDKLHQTYQEHLDSLDDILLLEPQKVGEALLQNPDYQYWMQAQERLGLTKGLTRQQDEEQPWNFVYVNVPLPNAFVSEIIPNTIFITAGLIQSCMDNDDELAMVLGHEVSHLIHGHMSELNELSVFFNAMEVMLLSLDPTEGLMSIWVLAFLAYLKRGLGAYYSRGHEREADALGIQLAAMGCYNTRRGAEVMKKMSERLDGILLETNESDAMATERSRTRSTTNFTDSHPPSTERYHALLEFSKRETMDTYSTSHCSHLRKSFFHLLRKR